MPTVDEIRRENLALAAAEVGGVRALSAILSKSESQVSQWINGSKDSKSGKPRGMRSDSCREIEAALGKPVGWLDRVNAAPSGVRDQAQPLGQVDAPNAAARLMSDPPMHDAPLISWGEAMRATDLPELFWLELPDDSMAPRARAGKRMGFSRIEPVKVGAGILARDPAGVLYFRRYIAAPAGQWIAHAENPDYADMHSERDGLQLVAVLIAEWGGWH